MASLYDALKASKTERFPDYWTLLWGRKLSAKMIKTLTGTLPLTFRTSERALRSWTIYGNNTPHNYSSEGTLPLTFTSHTAGNASDWSISGNDNIGKNLLNIIGVDHTQYGNTVKSDDAGRINITGAPTRDNNHVVNLVRPNETESQTDVYLEAGTYILSGTVPNTNNNYRLQIVCVENGEAISTIGLDEGDGFEFTIAEPAYVRVRILVKRAAYQQTVDLTFSPMLRPADTSADFEPYQIGVGQRTNNGYIVPLSVNGNTVNIPIGSAPLTAGQSVSKTSTGVDIAAQSGANTITTELYNKPEMAIEGVDYVGVGIPTANLFMIALQLKAGGQTLNVFNTLMNKPLRAGETLTSEQTGQTINTVAGVENKLSPAPKVASYGGSFEMTIKYKE